MSNTSLFAAFERFWQYVVALVGEKQTAIDDLNESVAQKTQVQFVTWGAED